MTSIYDLAKNGKVQELENKLKQVKDPNDYNDTSKKTALGVAVFNGDIATAQVLLKHGADPNGLKKGRPPLWIACNHRNDKANTYERLIQILLDKGADPKVPSEVASDKGSTPLIQAVKTHKSPSIISDLVDHGAEPDQKVGGKSAKDLAQGQPKILNAMKPYLTRFKDRAIEVGKVTGFIMAAMYWANRNLKVAAAAGAVAAVSMISKDAIRRRFRVSGSVDDRYKKYIKPDATFDDEKDAEKQELKDDMENIIKNNHLAEFFQKDDSFLEDVVNKAVDLNRDPDNLLDVKDLVHLAFYQPVLYCDDSGSMRSENRKEHLNGLSQRITSITTRVVPDHEGIELRFINEATTPAMSKPTSENVDRIIQQNPFHGWTEIGINLKKKVLEENVYKPLKQKKMKRPVLVSIITDGHPEGPENSREKRHTLKDAILECGKILETYQYKRNVVRFQISQIGSDPKAQQFLDDLKDDPDLKNILFITSERLDAQFRELHRNEDQLEQWLLELLMAPLIYAQPE
ncbi:hypothetical protein BO78DRAFT_425578 [Aspergillus sclerotiicarbonarius CBS 121057]|uniref:Uncharacterized protein n=1 Tax=Aspergillus sclerotiicarbonarius (strain CBS 121057 / IBT 28362) TaxID=1448318 RepID=A0A319EN22_ASPSB|nr:hypothetical protein BO78DRAFT_425578 [Aspergillus sclerotiicarbonarius CBS 121057]